MPSAEKKCADKRAVHTSVLQALQVDSPYEGRMSRGSGLLIQPVTELGTARCSEHRQAENSGAASC